MESIFVEQIVAKVALLPIEQQHLVLQFIESLGKRHPISSGSILPRRLRLKGATAGEGPALTIKALEEARKEMWAE